jgi:FKBP-type peptidyl-prolyl cis-trans isomerase
VTSHKDYYAALDVNPHADRRAIAEAYERLARKYQPDENAPPTDPQRMREIDEAFDVLDNPERRAQYDRVRTRPVAAEEPAVAAAGAGWAPGAEVPGEGMSARQAPFQWRSEWTGPALMGLGALIFIIGGLILLYAALSGDGERTVVLRSGLRYVETERGSGDQPHPGDAVVVHYTGRLQDGTVFDSSLERNPFVFVLGSGEVIPGWDLGFATMREGGERKLIVPPDLGYGPDGTIDGTIPPNATLEFEVELVEIQPLGQEITTDSGLRYIDLEPGRTERREAVSPEPGDEVVVHYTGEFEDGTRFADTQAAGQGYRFLLGSGSEIDGFEEGVSTMKVGGLRRLIVPPSLGYGDQAEQFEFQGQLITIAPNTTLIFEVRLIGAQDPSAQRSD